jgi:hypothetical protein
MDQGCQIVYFRPQNHNLGKFWRVWQWKMLVYFKAICLFYGHLVYFTAIWSILRPFDIFDGNLVYLVYFSPFGMFYEEKSGNAGMEPCRLQLLSKEHLEFYPSLFDHFIKTSTVFFCKLRMSALRGFLV